MTIHQALWDEKTKQDPSTAVTCQGPCSKMKWIPMLIVTGIWLSRSPGELKLWWMPQKTWWKRTKKWKHKSALKNARRIERLKVSPSCSVLVFDEGYVGCSIIPLAFLIFWKLTGLKPHFGLKEKGYPPWKHSTWKWMIGILVSFWRPGLFSRAFAVSFQGVYYNYPQKMRCATSWFHVWKPQAHDLTWKSQNHLRLKHGKKNTWRLRGWKKTPMGSNIPHSKQANKFKAFGGWHCFLTREKCQA